MTREEVDRASVLDQVIAKTLSQVGASIKLGVTDRHLRRILKNYKNHGSVALIHGLRGKQSNHKTPQEKLDEAIALIKEKYWDFGPTFAAEKLLENHKLKIDHDVLRKEMAKVELWRIKERKQKHRKWRERKHYFGEMVQFDGSHHAWFELRDKICCLLGSKDDATNTLYAHFSEHEDIKGVFTFWMEYIKKYGKPKSIYLDNGSVYKVNRKTVFDDPEVLTQFERACEELGIEVIHAKSPQAKGRIENGWGTLQDRLIKELRLRHIGNIKDANKYLKEEFLPKYNEKFSIQAKDKGNFHTALNTKENLDQIFTIRNERLINNDFTIRFKNKWFQLDEIQPKTILQKSQATIEEYLNGELKIRQDDKYLNFKEINKQDLETLRKQRKDEKVYVITSIPRTGHKPSDNHPWKRQSRVNMSIKKLTKTGHF
ncbi:MAG: ISNCY family transposase [Melioribacteraceae bacterium]